VRGSIGSADTLQPILVLDNSNSYAMGEDSAVDRVKELAREIARGVRPVFASREGSSGLEHIGTCLLIDVNGVVAAVTARHVLESPHAKFLGVSLDGSERWPATYTVADATSNPHADPDIAVAVLGPRSSANGYAAVPVASLAPAFFGPAGARLVAIGYPVSKSRNLWRDGRIRTGTNFATVEIAAKHVYDQLGLDPALQIAVAYANEGRVSEDGGQRMLAKPHGMSGGVLAFVAEEQSPDGVVRLRAFVVGVLTEFHNLDGGVLVATRLDTVLAALNPSSIPIPSGVSLRVV
jgi:hypothetical protein